MPLQNEKASNQRNEAMIPIPDGHVRIRITKFGDGKVSTGEHIAEKGDVMFKAGEETIIPVHVADALEKRGLAEIQ